MRAISGRKHHYLPRFLQRPFAFKQKGDRFYVHAHHLAHGTYPTNVMELGQELDFYGGPEDTSLDDAITDGEKRLAITVHRLNNGETVPQADIAQLMSALSIRTKAMRQALIGLMPVLLEAGMARIVDGKQTRKVLRKSLHNPVEQRKLVDEQIRKSSPGMNREQRAKMQARILPQWKSFVANNEEQFMKELHALVAQLFDRMMNQAASIADKAFINALSREPDMPLRAERFAQQMQFDVWKAAGEEFFVLGDCGPIALFTDGKPRLALGAMDDEVQIAFVFLPISPTKCVVGRREAGDHGLSETDLNRMSAALSHEFVVSHQEEGRVLDGLGSIIGSLTPIETEEAIFQALNDDLDEEAA